MDQENGRLDAMEGRLHCSGLRQKSKVPRARCSQRSDYVDCSPSDPRNGSLRKDFSPRDQQGMSTNPSSFHQLGDTDENKEWQRLVGERVCISGVKQGILRYFGRTNFAQGFWCGVELDEPVGKNNGTVHGVVYFSCQPNHGIFAPVSKVSKLNDLSSPNWRTETREVMSLTKQESLQRHSNWDYNLGLMVDADLSEKKYIKNSISDPSFLRATMRASMPRCSESFPYDKRNVVEQRNSIPLSIREVNNYEVSDPSARRVKSHAGSTPLNPIKNSSSSRSLNKYGYSKNQYFGSCHGASGENGDAMREIPSSLRPGAGKLQNPGLPTTVAEYEQYLRTPTNSGSVSPLSSEAKRFNEMPLYDYGKMPDAFLSSFQPRDFSDFEDDPDNDDVMSVEYDESLGILTPSQMKDLTLGPDFPASLSDIRGMDFPSSESFDDINDLPEDEQVHDVSVFRLSESSATRNVEVNKQNNSGNYSKNYTATYEEKGYAGTTDKFLYSMSQKDRERFSVDSRYISNSIDEHHRYTAPEEFGRTYKINNLSATNVLYSDQPKNNNVEKEVPSVNFAQQTFPKICEIEPINSNINALPSDESFGDTYLQRNSLKQRTDKHEMDHDVPVYHSQERNNKIKGNNISTVIETGHKVCDTDSSRDSLLPVETENNTTLKEKLTVSWEDCLSHSNDSMFSHVERPESVYTVGSNDTGFQEDGEMEGMTTSMDSTDDTKRFSTASRDSCIVTDDVDAYKIAESNSTSGYSTGLSDSCCNDRAEDDPSSKPLTDEEIQDSVGPCDSEDAFSFHENSISKDPEIMAMDTSEVTTDNATALYINDSTSDALCETMVEDSTLTEINELLLSPEENGSPDKTKEDATAMEMQEVAPSEVDNSNSKEEIENSVSTSSPAQSTPEKRPNQSRSREDISRRSNVTTNKSARGSKLCDEEADKRKQLVKSPKKNVMSKIKAMIEATSCKTATRTKTEVPEPVNRRIVSVPKKSRWEAVTSKIAASLAEEKTKPKAKREIKSRVDTNLSLARQQVTVCKSPRLDSTRLGDGSMSPISTSSRDRKPLAERNSAPSLQRESRVKQARDTKQRPKSPRPGKGLTSRSASPVAASESSTTSVSLNSHNSRNKIAHWKGSNSTIASSVPPQSTTVPKRPAPVIATKPTPVQNNRISTNRQPVTKKPLTEQTAVRGVHHASKPVRPPMWLSKAELTQEIQRLGTLCEARTKELNRLKMETKHVSVGFDAFAALFKYMVEDLNGMSVPMLSADLTKTLKQLELAKQDLAYYEREVEEMKAHHCQELNDLSNKLFEVFQGEVTELSAKHQEEMNHLKQDHQKQIENLSSTFNSTSEETIQQHEALVSRLQQELISQREELQLFQEKEILDLEEKHTQSTKTLQEHIEQLQKKCAELKQHSMGMEDAMKKDTDTKLQWVTSRKVDLEKEVESLKAVLEMKNKEMHTIRVQNLEMQKQLEELPFAREKIKMLQARAEDLEALMIEKTKLERKLSNENQQIMDTYEKESKVNRRLSMENEELQWRLRQAEQSLLSNSFPEVLEYPEDVENGSVSPSKSPAPQMSRSVFFTFVDKDDIGSPRTQYKKITPGFSASYKTSPAKSSKTPSAPSPRRAKSHSEPPQPPVLSSSTPRKIAKQSQIKQKGNQRLKRSGSDCGKLATGEQTEVHFLSVTGSMASSVSSDSSVFEHRERLLEDHKEQILESLEILREQRCSEGEEPLSPNSAVEKWREDVPKSNDESPNFEAADMSRSSEFSDPKTYYHMTFPVLKEAGIPDCDADESKKAAQPTHSTESSDVVVVSKEVGSLDITLKDTLSSQETGATGQVIQNVDEAQIEALAQSHTEDMCTPHSVEHPNEARFRTI